VRGKAPLEFQGGFVRQLFRQQTVELIFELGRSAQESAELHLAGFKAVSQMDRFLKRLVAVR
jgi:hypothetical protein